MKPTTDELLVIYRRSLARYEATGDDMAVVQRRLIARLEHEKSAEPGIHGRGLVTKGGPRG